MLPTRPRLGRNPRYVLCTLTDRDILEAIQIAQRIVDHYDQSRQMRNPHQDRCEHGFVDHGRERCWRCDPAVRHDHDANLALKQLDGIHTELLGMRRQHT